MIRNKILSILKKCRIDCFVGIKAFQNLSVSLKAFERMEELIDSDDHILLSSFLYVGVIRYAKPFLKTKTEFGGIAYPTRNLRTKKFSAEMHKNLIDVRNSLIAHDDFLKIEPRILMYGLTQKGTDFYIPTKLSLSNKCISHPASMSEVIKIKDHIIAALESIKGKLFSDMEKFRNLYMNHPNEAMKLQKYSKDFGSHELSKEGGTFQNIDLSENEWLHPLEPNFSEIKNGFIYERLIIERNFNGPETIKLPNGFSLELNPKVKT